MVWLAQVPKPDAVMPNRADVGGMSSSGLNDGESKIISLRLVVGGAVAQSNFRANLQQSRSWVPEPDRNTRTW